MENFFDIRCVCNILYNISHPLFRKPIVPNNSKVLMIKYYAGWVIGNFNLEKYSEYSHKWNFFKRNFIDYNEAIGLNWT